MNTLSFQYKALDRHGSSKIGAIVASSQQEAFRKLTGLGLTPVTIHVERGRQGRNAGRIKAKEIAHFTHQLSVMMGARISISDGLMSIAEQEKDPTLKRVITDIAMRIESGEPLASAMQAHVSAFGEVYVETIRAAERSGNMIKVLEHLSEMLERSAETSRQVRGAFMYPICVSAVLVLAVLFLVGVVIPKFATMFAERGAKLPWITEALMLLGTSMQSYWYAYLAAAVLAIAGFRSMQKSVQGRAAIDLALHRIPVIRELLVGLATARFARVFGITLGSGLALIECLELAGRAAGRPMIQRDIRLLIEQVRRGGRLREVFQSCNYFTPFTKRMLSAGEESAELPHMCTIIARHYDQETSYLAKAVATVIEPVMVVVIALVVLTIALAIFLPMWNMVNLVQ